MSTPIDDHYLRVKKWITLAFAVFLFSSVVLLCLFFFIGKAQNEQAGGLYLWPLVYVMTGLSLLSYAASTMLVCFGIFYFKKKEKKFMQSLFINTLILIIVIYEVRTCTGPMFR